MKTDRFKDVPWTLPCSTNISGVPETWEQIQVALLMDIRDELKRLNALLHCRNFVAIPSILGQIRENTRKPKRKRKVPR